MKRLSSGHGLLVLLVFLMFLGMGGPVFGMGVINTEPVEDGFEPPVNSYLADSPWPMTHRNPYCQASSNYPGPTPGQDLDVDFNRAGIGSITLAYSGKYPDGREVIWGSTMNNVFKVDPSGLCLSAIDKLTKDTSSDPISGAYTLVDNQNRFFVPGNVSINRYEDKVAGDADSDIVLAGTFTIPGQYIRAEGEHIVGVNLTYDGYLAIVTSNGAVGMVSRDFSQSYFLLLDEDEEVSNSIALDENHGIYIVTNKYMHRVQWTGSALSLDPADGAWTSTYNTGPETPVPGRLGTGSGTTPSLMGTGDMDKFVVIGDGQELMHIVIFWRHEIPADWEPIAPGVDRRIAAQIPITYGDAGLTRGTTEQSITVRGYSAAVVSNDYGDLPDTSNLMEPLDKINVLLTNLPEYAPYGVEKFTWDPSVRNMYSAWANEEISCPNGIPCMSAASGIMYCWGQRSTVWTLEAMDWATGESVFHKTLGLLPKYNSTYAGTEIGPYQNIVSGTIAGVVRVEPK